MAMVALMRVARIHGACATASTVGGSQRPFTAQNRKHRKALRDLLHAGDTGDHVAPDKMTLGQWIEHWDSIGCARQQTAPRAGWATVD